ncbi:hypothetical protein D021_0732A, partial [Vibrio parahaemolyticus 10296]|jgi:cullin 3
MSAVS